MELIATIVGYLVIGGFSAFVMTLGVYFTIHRIVDALAVRRRFLQMKKERLRAMKALRVIDELSKDEFSQKVAQEALDEIAAWPK